MSQNLDKKKIRDLIQKARRQDLLYLTISAEDKNSKRKGLNEILKFIQNKKYDVIIFELS